MPNIRSEGNLSEEKKDQADSEGVTPMADWQAMAGLSGKSHTRCPAAQQEHSGSCLVHLCHGHCLGYKLYHVYQNMITCQQNVTIQ